MPTSSRDELVAAFLLKHSRANNESAKKEHFLLLLRDLFGDDKGARERVDEIVAGAEQPVQFIKLVDREKTGRADSIAGHLIIEFESDLRKTGAHAEKQLKEYVYGEWQSGKRGPFTLIATDGKIWKVYKPHYVQFEEEIESAHDLDLESSDDFEVREGHGDDFYFFLDRYLFKQHPIRPTLESLKRDFGETSGVFLQSLDALKERFSEARGEPRIRVAFDQWQKMLAIAYGESFQGGEREFLVHTYLSVLAKVLAYQVLSHDDWIDDGEMEGILRGEIFDRYNVYNFVEYDFFSWVAVDEHRKQLGTMLHAIAQQVARYDFTHVDEDILKGVYQELIDLDTRHALGEYYTPDWLCEAVVENLDIEKESRMIDPACGSGSFLRAAVARLKRDFPDLTARELADQVVGIELHPLSVQIAKTTLLLALGPEVAAQKKPVRLHVYMANTLWVPEGSMDLFGSEFVTKLDGQSYRLSTKILDEPALFDAAVSVADQLAEAAINGTSVEPSTLRYAIRERAGATPDKQSLDGYWKIYEGLLAAKEAGRDSIWRFILQNTYRPFFLREQFDFVIGNPPWLTYSQITVAEYQDEIRKLGEKYRVMPAGAANRPHLEIAAIFLSHAARMFLKPGGSISFVLPRSFLTADHHTAFRSGKAENVRVTEIWDLDDVFPLFPVPACVIHGELANAARKPPAAGIDGTRFKGRLRRHNAPLKEAADRLTREDVTWYVGHLGKRTAFTTRKSTRSRKTNAYKALFRQGATIVPRNLYFVEVTQDVADLDDRSVSIRTDPEVVKLAKPPWKEHTLGGRVHSRFLFRTAQARSVLPFLCIEPSLVVLPVEETDSGLQLVDAQTLFNNGRLREAEWFRRAETIWDTHKTQRAKKNGMTYLDRIDYSRGLTSQTLASQYLVLYNTSAKDANACVVEQGSFDRPFVVDHVTYGMGTHSEDEAYFLAAFLNGDEPNRIIKDFQARGLFGARHVHKVILDVPLPRFDPSVRRHKRLADLGREAAAKAQAWADELPAPDKRPNLGQLRLDLRAHLGDDLVAIDGELEKVI